MLLTMANLVQSLVGMKASASHPITCLNPEPYFTIKEVRVDDGRIKVRGENTCWFGEGMVCVFPERVDGTELRALCAARDEARRERDALRARIEGAPVVKVRGAAIYVSHSLIGKRVALVVVND